MWDRNNMGTKMNHKDNSLTVVPELSHHKRFRYKGQDDNISTVDLLVLSDF